MFRDVSRAWAFDRGVTRSFEVFWGDSETFHRVSGRQRSSQVYSRDYQERFSGYLGFSGGLRTFPEVPEDFRENLKGSRGFQMVLGFSSVSQGCRIFLDVFRRVPEEFHSHSRGLQKGFRGSFKSV